MQRFVLTAAMSGLPTHNFDVAVLAAGCSVSLKELALETIHGRIFAQSAAARIDEGLGIDMLVTSSERGFVQGVAPVQNNRTGQCKDQSFSSNSNAYIMTVEIGQLLVLYYHIGLA